MPTRRSPLKRRLARRVGEDAIKAWLECDYLNLHIALGLHPADVSPLPDTACGLGCSEDSAPPEYGNRAMSWQRAVELQRLLFRVAGAPDCHKAYQANLEDAKEWAAYCQDLVDNPSYGGRGTGEDPETRQRNLEKALEALEWRQKLWDSLPKLN